MAKRTKHDKEQTKKQIALSRRQKKQKRHVLIGVGVVAALVLGVTLAGLYDQLIAKPARPVAVVYGARIRADHYQNRVLYERFILDGVLRNLQAQLSLLDPEDPANEFLIQYAQQYANQVYQQRLGVDQQALDDLVEEELVRQKAAELNLAVSEDEVNEAIRAQVAAQSGFLTESQATAIASTAVAVTATAETFTPTPEPTATPTLGRASSATATLVTTDTLAAAPEIPTDEPRPPDPTPTRHIITDDEFAQDYATYLSTLKEQIGITEAEYREIVRARLLVDKVVEYFADQTPTEAEQTNVSHIQVDTQEEAQAVLERLDAGEDFALVQEGLVATEVSADEPRPTDTIGRASSATAADGGELGWFIEGDLDSRFGLVFEEAAFSLEPGQYSQPISSPFGWHIVKVNERGMRKLNEYQLRTQQQQAYSDWLSEATNSEGVEILWEPDMAPPDPFLDQSSAPASSGLPPRTSPVRGSPSQSDEPRPPDEPRPQQTLARESGLLLG